MNSIVFAIMSKASVHKYDATGMPSIPWSTFWLYKAIVVGSIGRGNIPGATSDIRAALFFSFDWKMHR
jgi:hypothetical protein